MKKLLFLLVTLLMGSAITAQSLFFTDVQTTGAQQDIHYVSTAPVAGHYADLRSDPALEVKIAQSGQLTGLAKYSSSAYVGLYGKIGGVWVSLLESNSSNTQHSRTVSVPQVMPPGTYTVRIVTAVNKADINPNIDSHNDDKEVLDFKVTVTGSLGAIEANYEGFKYNSLVSKKNPNIIITSSKRVEKVEIYNMMGQKVKEVKGNTNVVATDGMNSGMYLMKTSIDGAEKIFRVIKQ